MGFLRRGGVKTLLLIQIRYMIRIHSQIGMMLLLLRLLRRLLRLRDFPVVLLLLRGMRGKVLTEPMADD